MSIEVPILLAAVVVVVFAVALSLIGSLRSEIRELRSLERRNGDLLQNLTRRVYVLEQRGAAPEALEAPPVPAVPPVIQPGPLKEKPAPAEVPAFVEEPRAEPAPVRQQHEDWEVIIGGNWLNKLGVLAIVVGVALFLGYSLTQLGPVGKVAIGLLIGFSMLGGGIALEGKPRYGTFAQGLIGGGWAAIYFTAYAMHGIEAARVIADPVIGTVVLLAVSVAMIGYSFRYRSQAITSIAYLIGFVTLNVTVVTGFSVVAALVLSVSLIVIAYRFSWFGMAALGILLTYGTFAARVDPVIYGREGIVNGQAILWIYWFVFEVFDLARIPERRAMDAATGALYLLNAGGFLVASLTYASAMHHQYWAGLFAMATVCYLGTTLVRARLLGSADSDFHVLRGGYFGPAMITAGYGAAALIESLAGLQLGYALLVEAELIVVAGVLLSRRFLVHVGCVLTALPILHLIAVDMENSARVAFAGHNWMQWSLFAIAIGAALYANRVLAGGLWLNSTVGSILLALVVHQEVQKSWGTVIWAAMAVALVGYGLLYKRAEFRVQGYLLAIVVFFRAWVVNMNDTSAATRMWTCAIIVALFYTAQMLFRSREPLPGSERIAQPGFSILGTAVLTMLLLSEVQGRLLTVAFGIEGIALLLAGFALRERVFRLSGLVLFLLCIAKLFVYDLRTLDTMSRILSFIVLGVMMVAASWVYTRFREQIRKLL
jgi:hypothetical protein